MGEPRAIKSKSPNRYPLKVVEKEKKIKERKCWDRTSGSWNVRLEHGVDTFDLRRGGGTSRLEIGTYIYKGASTA